MVLVGMTSAAGTISATCNNYSEVGIIVSQTIRQEEIQSLKIPGLAVS